MNDEELATIGRLLHAACLCANGLLGRILGTTLVMESRKEDLAMGKHLRLGWPFSDALIIGCFPGAEKPWVRLLSSAKGGFQRDTEAGSTCRQAASPVGRASVHILGFLWMVTASHHLPHWAGNHIRLYYPCFFKNVSDREIGICPEFKTEQNDEDKRAVTFSRQTDRKEIVFYA